MVIMAGQCAKQGCDSDLQDRLVLARCAARKVIARAEKGRCERGLKRKEPVWEVGHVRVVTLWTAPRRHLPSGVSTKFRFGAVAIYHLPLSEG